MDDTSLAGRALQYLQNNSQQISDEIGAYSYLIGDSLFFIAIGMAVVFVLHRLANRFLYPYFDSTRLLSVIFGTLYVLVLVVTALLVLKQVGFDVSTGGPVAILVVLFLAALLYFLIPYLPRLPFKPGHLVEVQGELGVVSSVSSFHTTLRRLDGALVFLPNALALASRIVNYSYEPRHRIEISVCVATDSDMDQVRSRLLAIAANDHRVLPAPVPVVHVTRAEAAGVQTVLHCWVESGDFLATRSDLWLQVLKLANEQGGIALSPALQEVRLLDSR